MNANFEINEHIGRIVRSGTLPELNFKLTRKKEGGVVKVTTPPFVLSEDALS
jgi:hypothetical protein